MPLIVYGVSCVWWDSIDKVSKNEVGLPCCPHCKGVLFQIEEAEWDIAIKKYEQSGHPGYIDFLTWLRGKCFLTQAEAEAAFKRPN